MDYHLDENVAALIAGLLLAAGRGAVTANEMRLRGAPDYLHLLTATQHERVVLTNNVRDFELLHGAWRTWSIAWGVPQDHAGILILDQRQLEEDAVREILAFEASDRPIRNRVYRWRQHSGWLEYHDEWAR